MAAFLDRVPQRGGVPCLCGRMRPAGSHTPRTPPQHTARRRMHARRHTCRPVPSVCVRNVRLLANRKRAYLIYSVAYNIYNILVRNGYNKIYNLCHSPHVRRLGRLKNTGRRVYILPTSTIQAAPQHCQDAARTDAHRQDAARIQRKGTARNGAI